jgi:hypothetical protein
MQKKNQWSLVAFSLVAISVSWYIALAVWKHDVDVVFVCFMND